MVFILEIGYRRFYRLEASQLDTPDYPYGEPGQTQRSRRIWGGRF